MNYVWPVLWILFALAVLGYVTWSVAVLYEQKNAWRVFATKYKLTALGGKKTMEAVSVTGILQGRKINIYSVSEESMVSRMMSVFTHIEVHLNFIPPAEIVIANKVMPFSLAALSAPVIFNPSGVEWPVRETNDPTAVLQWLTPARIAALKNYLALPQDDDRAIFISDGVQSYLLWRTDKPMRDPRALNALVQKLFAIVKDLDGDAGTIAKPNAAIESTPAAAPLIG